MDDDKKIKVFLTGGGTGGSVTPLLAMAEIIRKTEKDKIEFFWLGSRSGVEKEIVSKSGIHYYSISVGKLRRYFSLSNFWDIFKIIKGFFESRKIIKKEKPDLVMSAGSFVSVPFVWAAYFSKIPVWIHQQDVRPGLANKLMAPFAQKITVTFEKSLKDYGKKAVFLGNPVRQEFVENKIDKRSAKQKLGLNNDKPIVLVMGGGTGAMAINMLVRESIKELSEFCQIIHLTGKDKGLDFAQLSAKYQNYKSFEFLNTEGMIKVFTVADLVVSRAGMATLSELCFFQKPSILIPLPGTHQEENARIFEEKKATLVYEEKNNNKEQFISDIKKVLKNPEMAANLKSNIKNVIKTEVLEFQKIFKELIK